MSDGLSDLISAQQNLKCLRLIRSSTHINPRGLKTLAESIPNSLISISIRGGRRLHQKLLPCIPRLINLQELKLTFYSKDSYESFKELQHAIFPQLQILVIKCECPGDDLLIKFLENNGKNLKMLHIQRNGHALNSAVADLCPNLLGLSAKITYDRERIIESIINGCRYLNHINIIYENPYTGDADCYPKKGLTKNFPIHITFWKYC